MTKEEKIKEAWGENWSKISKENQKKALKNNGFVSQYYEDLLSKETTCRKLFDVRPKSLQGIENNNCWVKIESEEDLPKIREYDMSSFTLYYWTNNGLYESEDYKRFKLYYDNLKVTHYRLEPIFKPKHPIY